MGNRVRAQALGFSLATLGILAVASFALASRQGQDASPSPRVSQVTRANVGTDGGTIECHVWRDNLDVESGNTVQWEYQVAAKYFGSKTVTEIETRWYGRASLRNSATISVGIGNPSHAMLGSSWDPVETREQRWVNTRGQTESSFRDNLVISPKQDYRENTVGVTNHASVIVYGDGKPYGTGCGV